MSTQAMTAPATAKQNRPLRILLSEGSSLSARQSIYAIGRLGHSIDLLDPNSLCQGRFSKYIRRRIACPHFGSDPVGYLQLLVRLLKEHDYDVVIPTHEQVFLLARFRDTLSEHVGLALPDFATLDTLQSKAEFKRLLDHLDLPQPEAQIVRTREEFMQPAKLPCYVKLAYSTAGGGVFHARTKHDLEKIADRLDQQGLLDGHCEILLHQPASGVQCSVQTVFQHGRLVGAHVFEGRQIGVGGMSTARVSARHPVVVEHMRKLGGYTGWHGATFIDYFYDQETETPLYIEANPRIGETVNATLSSVNLCDKLIRVSLGEELPEIEHATSKIGVRTHSFFMILMTLGQNGAGRWKIFKEILKNWTGRGLYKNSVDDLTRPLEDWWSTLPITYIALQLLAWPPLANKIVKKTVDDYSLPDSQIQGIRDLPGDTVEQIFAGETTAGERPA